MELNVLLFRAAQRLGGYLWANSIMKKRWLIALPVVFAPVVVYAVAPLVVYVLAALNLHLAAGMAYDYFTRDVKSSSTAAPIRVHIKLNQQAPDKPADLSAPPNSPSVSIPSYVNRAISGGSVSVTVPTAGATNTNFATTTYSGSAAGLVQYMQYLQPGIYGLGSNQVYPGWSAASGNATIGLSYSTGSTSVYDSAIRIPQPPARNVSGAVVLTVTFNGTYSGSLSFPVSGASFSSCPAGYAESTSNVSQCNLADANAAVGSGNLPDYKCVISRGVPDPFDPDCVALKGAGAVSTGTDNTGNPVTQVKNPGNPNDPTVTTTQPKPDGGQQVSQSNRGNDGAGQMQTTNVGPGGQVGPVTGVNYPGSPAPEYPGQSNTGGGSGNTGGGTGQSETIGSGCGGDGQPKCQIDPGDPVEGTPDGMPDGIGGALDGLKSKTVTTSSSCPSDIFSFEMPLPAVAGGPIFVSDNGIFCGVMGQYQDLFRAVSIAGAWIMAMFIVLRA